MTTAQETIDALAGRDNLPLADMKKLVLARRAQAPTEETFERDGWLVTISHHVHTGGHWSGSAALQTIRQYGSANHEADRCLSSGDTEADCRRKVGEFFTSGLAAKLRTKLEKTWSDYAAWAARRDQR